MEICNIISSGSHGNCEIYNKNIMVDIGVSFGKIAPYIKDLQLVIVSHAHFDHMNISTIRKLAFERPTVRFAIGSHLLDYFKDIRNVDICEVGKWYDYGHFKIAPVKLYHDVENFGWRIFIKQPDDSYLKIFRATDTFTLDGIVAKEYDYYYIESNYDEDYIQVKIAEKAAAGKFSYEKGSINSHLSEQQANDFFYRNKGENSQLIRLHESKIIKLKIA